MLPADRKLSSRNSPVETDQQDTCVEVACWWGCRCQAHRKALPSHSFKWGGNLPHCHCPGGSAALPWCRAGPAAASLSSCCACLQLPPHKAPAPLMAMVVLLLSLPPSRCLPTQTSWSSQRCALAHPSGTERLPHCGCHLEPPLQGSKDGSVNQRNSKTAVILIKRLDLEGDTDGRAVKAPTCIVEKAACTPGSALWRAATAEADG